MQRNKKICQIGKIVKSLKLKKLNALSLLKLIIMSYKTVISEMNN